MADEPERRELSFKNLDEVIADAEKLASGEVRTTGNHGLAKILNHLALSIDMTTGRVQGPKPPFYVRLMMPLMKRMIINDKPIKPGFKLPSKAEAFSRPTTRF